MSAPLWQIVTGDTRQVAKTLEPGSVHALVTSPPYYSPRAYPGDPVIWPSVLPPCPDESHDWEVLPAVRLRGQSHGQSAVVGNTKHDVAVTVWDRGAFCRRCQAWRGQLGLEPSRRDYALHLASCLNVYLPALHESGSLWLNLGDTYDHETGAQLGIPQCVTNVLSEHWLLRSTIIWVKPNHAPESVLGWHYRPHQVLDRVQHRYVSCPGCAQCQAQNGMVLRRGHGRPTRSFEVLLQLVPKTNTHDYYDSSVREPGATRALSDVWTIPTEPLPSWMTHTAAYPEELAKRAIRLATSALVCGECGAPFARSWEPPKDRSLSGYTPRLVPGLQLLPTCTHHPVVPMQALVVDPFSGSGRTGIAALHAGRRYLGVEYSSDLAEESRRYLHERVGAP